MTLIASLRDGLKARLATISGLRAHDTWPGQVNPPAALVRPVSWAWETMDSTTKRYQLEVIVVVQIGNLGSAQDKLDAYASDEGTASVEAALLVDGTLGGVADDILQVGMRDYGTVEVNGVEYLGFVLDVALIA